MTLDGIIGRLKTLADPAAAAGMAKYGINPEKTLGISIPTLRKLAKEIGTDHNLALGLWDSGYHEARILASMVDNLELVDEAQADRWAAEFDSWDVCDQCIINLFEDAAFAWDKAVEWSAAGPEFVKRAGFVLMARLAVSDRRAEDERFLPFLPIIERESVDGRNFVKKAVNWALRQIGKRNSALNGAAVEAARRIAKIDSRAAKWIAADALRELTDAGVERRLVSMKERPVKQVRRKT